MPRATVAEQPDPADPGGCYRLELVSCGKDRCTRCAGGPAHGPYWYRYYRRNGKLVSRYVGKNLPAAHADFLVRRGDIDADTARALSGPVPIAANGPAPAPTSAGPQPDPAPARTGVWAIHDARAEDALPAARDAAGTLAGAPPGDRIRAAYRILAAGEPGAFVRIADLRRALPDVPRGELDAALDRMYRDQQVNLVPQADQMSLTGADRQSALRIGGENKHRISIEDLAAGAATAPAADAERRQHLTGEIRDLLCSAQSRDDAARCLDGLGLKKAGLLALAGELGVHAAPGMRVADIKRKIVDGTAGVRLSRAAILGGGWEPRSSLGNRDRAVEHQVLDAYRSLAEHDQQFVTLTELRSRLPGMPRDEIDAALERMYRRQDINLIPRNTHRMENSPEDYAAEIRIGGQDKFKIAEVRRYTEDELRRYEDDRSSGQQPGPAGKAAPPAPVSGRMSGKPLTANRWGSFAPADYPVNFHKDGAIGRAIDRMGRDARLDIDGEPLADVLGRAATDAVTGRASSQHVLDRVKQLRDRLPERGAARRELDMAISELDAPATPVPPVPDGTPEPLRQLMTDLHAVPLVRRDPGKEQARLTRILDDFAAGRGGGLRMLMEIRQNLLNCRHESTEGKFEIDRAVQRALDSLEALARTRGRSALRPPGTR